MIRADVTFGNDVPPELAAEADVWYVLGTIAWMTFWAVLIIGGMAVGARVRGR